MSDQSFNINGQDFDTDLNYFSFDLEHSTLSDQKVLGRLKRFLNMTSASFALTNLNDEGLQYVTDCTGIETLDLQGTEITNDGLEFLSKLPRLKSIRLKENPQLTNDCIPHLKKLTALEDLQIHETGITESGLKELTSLPKLNAVIVQVWDGNFSYDGLMELSKQMPECEFLAKGRGAFENGEFDGEWEK